MPLRPAVLPPASRGGTPPMLHAQLERACRAGTRPAPHAALAEVTRAGALMPASPCATTAAAAVAAATVRPAGRPLTRLRKRRRGWLHSARARATLAHSPRRTNGLLSAAVVGGADAQVPWPRVHRRNETCHGVRLCNSSRGRPTLLFGRVGARYAIAVVYAGRSLCCLAPSPACSRALFPRACVLSPLPPPPTGCTPTCTTRSAYCPSPQPLRLAAIGSVACGMETLDCTYLICSRERAVWLRRTKSLPRGKECLAVPCRRSLLPLPLTGSCPRPCCRDHARLRPPRPSAPPALTFIAAAAAGRVGASRQSWACCAHAAARSSAPRGSPRPCCARAVTRATRAPCATSCSAPSSARPNTFASWSLPRPLF